ncbi:peptidoglycan-associated lipoprotein Pal [Thiohalomonas denitrificans]|uniref:peptidoglycan-associated lipoprotein Pal n=1 Tax=Thiohalomonas denitrificans TaxID=415747 RepID=UPI0026EB0B78|nr:peptidoglycan-associated lipoprotein Pal [Thiohalomonas denitrificans]
MKQVWLFWGVLATSVMVSGCAGVAERDGAGEDVVIEDIDDRAVAGDARAAGARMDGKFEGSPLDDPESPLSQRVFYFDFDSSELSENDREALVAHGRFLASNPDVSVAVEGHTDERGTREYNLALGERRAQAVERLLSLQAAAEDQLQVISFGEESPAAMGHDEGAWSLNRRVELLYSGY